MSRPIGYLLSGLPCSGKSTYARALAATGVVQLSLDDTMTQRFGRPGKDYPGHLQPEQEPDVLRQLDQQLVDLLRAGVSVVLDHGLGRRDERDRYKRLVTDAGAEWVLVRFDLDIDELLRRLQARNAEEASGLLTEQTLRWMVETSEPPEGEGEIPAV